MKRIISFVLCAAMLMSSFVFVVSAADPQVQSVIDKINAIGDVHRNEKLLEDVNFNGHIFDTPTGGFGYHCYGRIAFKDGFGSVKEGPVLLWNRDFQVTLQFVPAESYPKDENGKSQPSFIGGKIDDKAWVGYNFSEQKFFIGSSADGGPSGPTRYIKRSEVMELDPGRAYTMTMKFVCSRDAAGNITVDRKQITDPGYISVIVDGETVCTTEGEQPLMANGRDNRNFLAFDPYEVNSNMWEWHPFTLYPCNTRSYLVRFEAATLDATWDTVEIAYNGSENVEAELSKPLRVTDPDENIKTNGFLKPATFTCDAYLDSGEKIHAAKTAYMQLTPPQKKEVANYSDLVKKMREYYTLQPAYGGISAISSEALAVVDLIDAIGTVSPSSEDAIVAAENGYAALTDAQKAEVYNYDVLVCSRQEFDAFSDPAVTDLIDAIEALFPVTLDTKDALIACEAKYNSFNSAQKASVTNYDKLLEARKTYDDLCVENVRALIGAIGDVTKDSADAVNAAKTEYDALREDLKARLADVKPVLDAAKTDLRMINLDGLDYTDSKVMTEVRLTKNYYQIQTDAAKALMKNKSYLDAALDTVTDVVSAQQINAQIDMIGTVSYMDGTKPVQGISFMGKSNVGYSNLDVLNPLGTESGATMHAPYILSFDLVIKRWMNNADDNTARIAVYTDDVVMGYNGVEKKFVIGDTAVCGGFSGKNNNPIGTYAESPVTELKLNVPYNFTFEVDRDHFAIYLNGKLMASTTEVGMNPDTFCIVYPGGLEYITTGYNLIFNGEVLADNVTGAGLVNAVAGDKNTAYTWKPIGAGEGWGSSIVTYNDAVNDSGYMVETLYNRYMALGEEEKKLVTKADTLIAKYEEYTSKKNLGLVSDAIAAIDKIGTVTLDSIGLLQSAEYAYSEVPEDLRDQVTNAAVLTAARAKYDELYGNDLKAKIDSIGEVTADKLELVKGIKAAYDAMTDNQKSYVTNVDVLDAALNDLAEFAKAEPVIDAIRSFIGADFNDETPIAGQVKHLVMGTNNYTELSGAKDYLATKWCQIDYDFKFTEVESATTGVIQGSNGGGVLTGIDIAHGLIFIKKNTMPFGAVDPQLYDVSSAYTFRPNRWYHFTVKYDNNVVKIFIDGQAGPELQVENDFAYNTDWYIMTAHGIDGYLTNVKVSTNAQETTLDPVTPGIGGVVQDPPTTIGQENRDNVTRARAMYNALSPKARTAVTNYKSLTDTERLLGMTSPNANALAVIDMINALDQNSAQEDIDAAEAAYRALTTAEKKTVTNYGYIAQILNQRAAAEVEAKIAALTVDSSDEDIAVAEAAYNKLTAAQQAFVTNYARIAELRSAKAVKAVVDAIAALDETSAEADVTAAQNAYNALTDAEKAQVTNYADLEALVSKISAAKVKAVVDAIDALTADSTRDEVNAVKAQYDALTDAEKAQVTNVDKLNELLGAVGQQQAQAVIDAIAALNDESTEEEIYAVKAQYDALTADEQALVTNYADLKAKIDAIASAKAKVVSDQIAALDEKSDEAALSAAEAAYQALDDDAKAFVTNYSRIADIRGAQAVTAMIAALTNDSSDEDVAKALAAYGALSEMGQFFVKNYDQLEAIRSAKAVAAVIAAIDALTKDSTDEEIDAAEAAYDALTEDEKALVTNYGHIEEVREQKKDPAVQAVILMISRLNENSTNEEINAAIAAYEALTDAQKAEVWNYDTITEICMQKAAGLVARIDTLPDAYLVDIYHHESLVNEIAAAYDALVDEAKAAVTNYAKLEAIVAKLDGLHEWDDNKAVNILNSTLAAMAEYTQEDIDAFAAQQAVGLYYMFEEVGLLERGDPTTGYLAFEEAENEKVKDQKYVKLAFDINVTDVDVINGWPMLYKFTIGPTEVGYDFVNKAFYCGELTDMNHGALEKADIVVPHDFALGVWHHLEFVLDGESVSIVFDGEKVLEGKIEGVYNYLISYPWLCNLEMTNVVYTDKFGTEMLSPFRNAVNNPTGWSKKGNDKGAVMLDHVKTSVENARAAYEALTDEEKAQIVGIEVLDKVSAMIDRVGKNDVVVTDGTANVEYAAEGDTVIITAGEAPEGKVFDKWEIVSGEITLADANAAETTFTMPATKVELKATYKNAYTRGDVNGDGSVNAKDISAIMKHMLGNTPEGFIVEAADYNADGTVNAKDVSAIMKDMLNK